jgi:negative regulator of sigma E activity
MLRLFGRRRDERERRDELLSAYLDGELTEAERERLEARLAQDPSLRAELQAMRSTVSLMRELPQVSAPRNFILTASMVEGQSPARETRRLSSRARAKHERRARAWAAPLLTVATAAVSVLFVVVLVGDLLLPGVGGLASAPAPEREAAPKIALEAAPTGEGAPAEAEVEEYDSGDLPSPPPASAEPTAVGGAAPLRSEESMEAPEMAAEEEKAGDLAVPTVAPTATAMAALTPTIPAEAPVVSEGELGLVEPTPDDLEVTPRLIQDEGETDRLEPPSMVWRTLEVALGLASLALIVATIRAWRLRHG